MVSFREQVTVGKEKFNIIQVSRLTPEFTSIIIKFQFQPNRELVFHFESPQVGEIERYFCENHTEFLNIICGENVQNLVLDKMVNILPTKVGNVKWKLYILRWLTFFFFFFRTWEPLVTQDLIRDFCFT
jgi:hypothetical protein